MDNVGRQRPHERLRGFGLNAPIVGTTAPANDATTVDDSGDQGRAEVFACPDATGADDDIERQAIQDEPQAAQGRPVKPSAPREQQPSKVAPPNLAELCGTFPGVFKRIPTGIEPLDNATGGGFQTSRFIVIGGAPGANKTSLLTSLGYNWASRGVAVNGQRHEVLVVIFATDEPRHGILSRIGQMYGLSRADLDSEDTGVSGPAWANLRDRLSDTGDNLAIFDSRFENVSVEDVIEWAAANAKGRRVAVIVDSLHSAPFSLDDPAQDSRLKMEARVKRMTYLATKHKICLIATSELNRGSYRNRVQAENSSDLAAFKESSGIEYGADLGLLLRSVPEGKGLVIDVSIAKNRLGPNEIKFRLERGARLDFREVPIPEEEQNMSGANGGACKLERDIIEAVKRSGGAFKSANDICTKVKGRKQDILQKFKELRAAGRLVHVNGVIRVGSVPEAGARDSSPDAEAMPCKKCGGSGKLKEYEHNADGVCFRCGGSGVDPGRGGGGAPPAERRSPSPLEDFDDYPEPPEPSSAPSSEPQRPPREPSTRSKPTSTRPPSPDNPMQGIVSAMVAMFQQHGAAPSLDWMRAQLVAEQGWRTWQIKAGWDELRRAGRLEKRGKGPQAMFYLTDPVQAAAGERGTPPETPGDKPLSLAVGTS
ncbi:DnaB-like helicase C-terminal domain-containing protein [Sorangium sp. So ce590]|uniref:DnaB-like helicase C-terminal domain-containing protein n=1 Tax=Sorangium sp. So ce590 TaxID=3133317 RepID=UPI003F6006A2